MTYINGIIFGLRPRRMMRGTLSIGLLLALATLGFGSIEAAVQNGQQPGQTPSFKSGVDLVRVTAIVRDHKGRLVPNLLERDFEVLDSGTARPIIDFHGERTGISVAVLLDVSGSMQANFANAREAATQLLAWLEANNDEAAIFTFDTRLDEIEPFTSGLQSLPNALSSVTPFGATSLHDAIAGTAERLGSREGRRRAVVVFTDGNDNASRLTPGEVSAIASSIDVPVYIFGIVASIDNPSADTFAAGERSPLSSSLTDLSTWTGGRTIVASTIAERSAAAREVVEELRHQYVIAFESSARPGWHPLVIRARGKDLTVRSRSGYIAGQSRPNSAFGTTQDDPGLLAERF